MLLQFPENQLRISQHLANGSKLQLCWDNFCENLSTNFLNKPTISSATKMAALPHGAFAACKLRQQFDERELIVSRMRMSGADKNGIDNQKHPEREYSPAKYNGKLMNSIWGLYNRYSPHNVKKNEYVPPKY